MRPFFKSAASLFLLLMTGVFHTTASEAQAESDSAVVVKVRAIRAAHPKSADKELRELKIDPRLDDVSDKLHNFDFRSFRMISDEVLTIPIKKKESINLTEKTVLNVRPLYRDAERIGMWLKWTDLSGEQVLLDTRMHLSPNESMLTGTNCKNNKALILAISARAEN